MSAAVLSLSEIIMAAESSTEIRVPSGSVWSSPGGRLLGLRGDGQRLVPADLAGGHGIAQRVEHVELDRRAERRRGARDRCCAPADRAITDLGHEQMHLGGD